MASIHREHGKPNWFCHYYDPEGFRRKRSTETENAKIARTLCVNIERAAILTRQGKLSNEKALKLVRETGAAITETHGKLAGDRAESILKSAVEQFIKIAGGEFTSYTVRSWLDSWLAGRTDASKATVIAYRHVIDLFFKYLGARADRALTTLQPSQVEEFKGRLAQRVAPSTVNRAIKVLKAAFHSAVKARQLEFNPAQHVEFIQTEESGRRPFTSSELSKVLKAAKTEWKTMVLLGYYTGQRLQDCANVTEEKVHWMDNDIALTTQKTGRDEVIPIHPVLLAHLEKLKTSDDPKAPICPSLYGKPPAWLSAQFYKVMVKAGIVPKRGHESTGKGRDGKRERNAISFHSLRYNCTSALKSSGVSDSVAMDIVGHETASVSRNYTKIDDAAKRAAVNKLPDITK